MYGFGYAAQAARDSIVKFLEAAFSNAEKRENEFILNRDVDFSEDDISLILEVLSSHPAEDPVLKIKNLEWTTSYSLEQIVNWIDYCKDLSE